MTQPICKREATETFIDPEMLHKLLKPTQTREVTFHSEKALRSYRAMIYAINKQGEFRYRTLRSEDSMWGILLWRMK